VLDCFGQGQAAYLCDPYGVDVPVGHLSPSSCQPTESSVSESMLWMSLDPLGHHLWANRPLAGVRRGLRPGAVREWPPGTGLRSAGPAPLISRLDTAGERVSGR
jgi:hypothetical protein